jgi:uncharacterized protein involved in exopolysaccharide biosynthesis
MNSRSRPDSNAEHPSDPAGSPLGFRFPLPIDPIRLAAGVVRRWPWLLLGAMAGTAAGVAAGIAIHHPVYSISTSLLRRAIPSTVKTGEVGTAYRPSELNDKTLLATILAVEPLDKAVGRADNGLTPADARSYVEASQLEGTDIFFATYHSHRSAEDAVAFARIWMEEINAYTQRLQRSEARATLEILRAEVSQIDAQLKALDDELLRFSTENEFLGSDTQVTAALNQAGMVRLELANARAELDAKDIQIKSLTEQIRKQSPLDNQLKKAREELGQLRASYTDRNPLVQAKLQTIAFIESQLQEIASGETPPLEFYTGSEIGNQLFLDIIALRNERVTIAGKLESFEKLAADVEERIAGLPAIVAAYDSLRQRRESLLETRTLLGNRLEEAKIFASSSPGYWQPFQPADARDVQTSSPLKKPLALGLVGFVGGGGLSLLMVLLLTRRSTRRSALECCTATRAPLTAALPIDDQAAFATFWLSDFVPLLQHQAPVLIWSSHASAEDEMRFWNHLARAAKDDGSGPVRIASLDDSLGPLPPPFERTEPAAADILQTRRLPGQSQRHELARVSHWLVLARGEKDPLSGAGDAFHRIAEAHLPPPSGTLALIEPGRGPIQRSADAASHFLATYFSKPPATRSDDD